MKTLKRHLFIPFFLLIQLFAFSQDSIHKPVDTSKSIKNIDTSSARPVSEEDVSRLLTILNNIYITLNRVNATTNNRLNVDDIESQLAQVTSNLKGLKENLSSSSRVLTIRTLQMYRVLITEMLSDLEDWRNTLSGYEDKIEASSQDMQAIRKDSSLRSLLSNKNLRTQYLSKLRELRNKWHAADSTSKLKLQSIQALKNKISENYIDATEAQTNIREQLRNVSKRTFTNEAGFIWQPFVNSESAHQSKASKTYMAERNAMHYYFSKRFANRILMLLFAVIFFIWVFFNFRFLKKQGNEFNLSEYRYLRPKPLTASLPVMLDLSPFFDHHAPAVYFEMMQFFLLIVLTISFWRRWPKKLSLVWTGIVVLYLIFSISRTIVVPTTQERLLFILLNIITAVCTTYFSSLISKRVKVHAFIKPILMICVTLNIAAALFNVFGRITLAHILGTAGISGATQIIGLSVFMQLMTEAFYLQVQKSRKKNLFQTPVTFDEVSPRFRALLSFIVIVLWAIVFTVNMNMYEPIYQIFSRILNQPRVVGSTNFTLANLFVFMLILWVSFILQKFTGYFMGIVDQENVITENMGRKGNKLLFLRLVIIIAGFLLAIAASGLPLDKLTIVFSALGVGIGLGLQNIVNNFVSGIILIFERPFHIGDTIEVGSKLGVVKNISVRSSVIQTDKGAEIIVPNGDLLSQQVTNWTLSNRHVQRELKVSLDGKTDYREAKTIISKIVKSHPQVIQLRNPVVLIEDINEAMITFVIQYWVSDINTADEIQSDIRTAIFMAFNPRSLNGSEGNGITVHQSL